jgi:surfeit locus 1 family protein
MEQSLAETDQNQHQQPDDDVFDQHSSQYNLSLKFGSRIFTPRPFTTLLTLALLAMLLSLGRWQLHRADEKRALYDSFASGADATRSIDAQTPPLPRYQHVEARGHYDASRQLLIDNMFDAEKVGYYVITPFALDGGGWVLVNRGWVALGKSRNEHPSVPVPADERHIRGRIDHLPAAGIQLGKRLPLSPPFPVVASFPTHDEVVRLLREATFSAAGENVLLDAAEPDGYARHWAPPGFPPIRHIGYAVQWFALAAALFVIYLVMNFKRAAAPTVMP